MTPLIILEAFGQFATPAKTALENSPTGEMSVGDFRRAFRGYAELLGWSHGPGPDLWILFEEELGGDEDDPSLLGSVYVGLANPTELGAPTSAMTLPGTGARWVAVKMPPDFADSTVSLTAALVPLVQCLDQALRRMGVVEVSGFQMVCYDAHFQPNAPSLHLAGGVSWFDGIPQQESTNILVSLDNGLVRGPVAERVLRQIKYGDDFLFDFGVAVHVPEWYRVRTPKATPRPDVSLQPSSLGISVRMPEWSAIAVGWTMATIADAARDVDAKAETLALRVSRTEDG